MPTLDHFEAAIDAMIEGPIAMDAVYTPKTGGAFALRILPDLKDDYSKFGGASFVVGTFSFRARPADIANPATGDVIEVGGNAFTVQGKPAKGARHLWWEIEAAPNDNA